MTTVNNQSPTNLGSCSLNTYLRQPPMAALKIKSRNGEVSLKIQLKKLRLHSVSLCYPQKNMCNATPAQQNHSKLNKNPKQQYNNRKSHTEEKILFSLKPCAIFCYPNITCQGKETPNNPKTNSPAYKVQEIPQLLLFNNKNLASHHQLTSRNSNYTA